MTNLADLFAFLYGTDLQTLDRVVLEADRILAERKHGSRPESSPQTVAIGRVNGGS